MKKINSSFRSNFQSISISTKNLYAAIMAQQRARRQGRRNKPMLKVYRYSKMTHFRGVFSFLKPGWLGGENVLQVKHFDTCALYFLKSRGG